MGESFETSVPWANALTLCTNVKQKVKDVAAACGVKREPFLSCRVTQLYDTGCCST
jgi:alkyldihydroxyacetonephosphate synthase